MIRSCSPTWFCVQKKFEASLLLVIPLKLSNTTPLLSAVQQSVICVV